MHTLKFYILEKMKLFKNYKTWIAGRHMLAEYPIPDRGKTIRRLNLEKVADQNPLQS